MSTGTRSKNSSRRHLHAHAGGVAGLTQAQYIATRLIEERANTRELKSKGAQLQKEKITLRKFTWEE